MSALRLDYRLVTGMMHTSLWHMTGCHTSQSVPTSNPSPDLPSNVCCIVFLGHTHFGSVSHLLTCPFQPPPRAPRPLLHPFNKHTRTSTIKLSLKSSTIFRPPETTTEGLLPPAHPLVHAVAAAAILPPKQHICYVAACIKFADDAHHRVHDSSSSSSNSIGLKLASSDQGVSWLAVSNELLCSCCCCWVAAGYNLLAPSSVAGMSVVSIAALLAAAETPPPAAGDPGVASPADQCRIN